MNTGARRTSRVNLVQNEWELRFPHELFTSHRPSIPSIISAILTRRSVRVGFIESVQHALAKSSYPLRLQEVGFIECCHIEIIVSAPDGSQ